MNVLACGHDGSGGGKFCLSDSISRHHERIAEERETAKLWEWILESMYMYTCRHIWKLNLPWADEGEKQVGIKFGGALSPASTESRSADVGCG